MPEISEIAWTDCDARARVTGFTHLASEWPNPVTLCGKPVGKTWLSASAGLFFKRKVLQRHDGQLCPVCLEKSGGKGPINRPGRRR